MAAGRLVGNVKFENDTGAESQRFVIHIYRLTCEGVGNSRIVELVERNKTNTKVWQKVMHIHDFSHFFELKYKLGQGLWVQRRLWFL